MTGIGIFYGLVRTKNIGYGGPIKEYNEDVGKGGKHSGSAGRRGVAARFTL
jgi:hypothetical protein